MAAHPMLFTYLWIAPHLLLVALAVMMVRRKLVREFPSFFAYTVYEAVQFVVLYAMYHSDAVSGHQYTVVWLLGNCGSVALRFAIVHEIFGKVFESYPALKDFCAIVFRWATVVLLLVAVVLVGWASGYETDRLTTAYTVVDRAVSIVQGGLLVLILLLSRFFSFPWRSYVFGIALGIGFFASVELGIIAIRTQVGVGVRAEFFDMLSMAAYHCCVLLWIVTLLLPEREETRVTSVPAHNLDHWNDALQRLLHQ
jgi:hypothetical protein